MICLRNTPVCICLFVCVCVHVCDFTAEDGGDEARPVDSKFAKNSKYWRKRSKENENERDRDIERGERIKAWG